MSDGYAMTDKEISLYLTIITLYEQQKYMYNNKVHSVEHRIVSISQPWLRPIARGNQNYCKDHGIRLSGPKPGRPISNAKIDKKQEYQDNTDRIEVERTFSLSKRCYGMDCITTKLEETQLASIALSVFVTNLFKIQKRILFALLRLYRIWGRYEEWNLQMSA